MATRIHKNKFTKLIDRLPVSIHLLVFVLLLVILSSMLQGCTDSCETTQTYTYYEPVYTSLEELRSMVEVTEPSSLENPGKIYLKDNHLFISEVGKGIHVIDNNDPSNPTPIAFVAIPGTSDLSAKGNYLYADSYIDLVVLDISNLNNIHEVNRLDGVFNNYNDFGVYVDSELGIVTDWQEVEQMEIHVCDCDEQIYPYQGDILMLEGGIAALQDMALSSSTPIGGGNPGVGGSMATFTIYDNYLYTIDDSGITIIDITTLNNPLIQARQFVGWGIETLFPYQDKLFIGSNSGMYIYDNIDPKNPTQLSVYEHITSCDPVVVSGDYAYVTLRSGTDCQGFSNQLEVVNISDLTNPYLEETYSMYNPHGLGIDNNTLFICDGEAGLKIYDATDIHAIEQNLIIQYGDIHAQDVIPFNNVLMMIGEDGLSQYDYSNLDDIKFLSLLPISSSN